MFQNRKAAVGFIFVTLMIDVIGFGIIIPVMPKLIADMKHIPVNEASEYGSFLLSIYAIVQFVCAPIIGNLSDRYGRRPVLLLSLFAFAIDYLFLALAPSYGYLFIGRIIAGVTGASFTTASAYIADVSTKENRAKNFGLIGAAFGLGFIIGPFIGGQLSSLGLRAPFFAAAILCILNCLYGYFVLPESLKPENRRSFKWARANPFGSFKLLKKYRSVGSLAIAFFLIYLGSQAVQGNWSYYTIFRFQWSSKMVGYSLATVGLLVASVQVGLIRVINPRIGNYRSIYLGLCFYALGMLLFAFANQGWMMFVFLIPYCLGGIAGPALQSTIAGHVPPNEQGELQGALTSLMSLSTIFGPLIMNNLFSYFTHNKAPFQFPGAPFLLGSVLFLASAVIAFLIFRREQKTDPALVAALDAKASAEKRSHH